MAATNSIGADLFSGLWGSVIGAVLGAVIGGLVTVFVLYRTLRTQSEGLHRQLVSNADALDAQLTAQRLEASKQRQHEACVSVLGALAAVERSTHFDIEDVYEGVTELEESCARWSIELLPDHEELVNLLRAMIWALWQQTTVAHSAVENPCAHPGVAGDFVGYMRFLQESLIRWQADPDNRDGMTAALKRRIPKLPDRLTDH